MKQDEAEVHQLRLMEEGKVSEGDGKEPTSPNRDSSCSICLEPVDTKTCSFARLRCKHEFHLGCIGSAFNAKGEMQCPNCRSVAEGTWQFGSRHVAAEDVLGGGMEANLEMPPAHEPLPYHNNMMQYYLRTHQQYQDAPGRHGHLPRDDPGGRDRRHYTHRHPTLGHHTLAWDDETMQPWGPPSRWPEDTGEGAPRAGPSPPPLQLPPPQQPHPMQRHRAYADLLGLDLSRAGSRERGHYLEQQQQLPRTPPGPFELGLGRHVVSRQQGQLAGPAAGGYHVAGPEEAHLDRRAAREREVTRKPEEGANASTSGGGAEGSRDSGDSPLRELEGGGLQRGSSRGAETGHELSHHPRLYHHQQQQEQEQQHQQQQQHRDELWQLWQSDPSSDSFERRHASVYSTRHLPSMRRGGGSGPYTSLDDFVASHGLLPPGRPPWHPWPHMAALYEQPHAHPRQSLGPHPLAMGGRHLASLGMAQHTFMREHSAPARRQRCERRPLVSPLQQPPGLASSLEFRTGGTLREHVPVDVRRARSADDARILPAGSGLLPPSGSGVAAGASPEEGPEGWGGDAAEPPPAASEAVVRASSATQDAARPGSDAGAGGAGTGGDGAGDTVAGAFAGPATTAPAAAPSPAAATAAGAATEHDEVDDDGRSESTPREAAVGPAALAAGGGAARGGGPDAAVADAEAEAALAEEQREDARQRADVELARRRGMSVAEMRAERERRIEHIEKLRHDAVPPAHWSRTAGGGGGRAGGGSGGEPGQYRMRQLGLAARSAAAQASASAASQLRSSEGLSAVVATSSGSRGGDRREPRGDPAAAGWGAVAAGDEDGARWRKNHDRPSWDGIAAAQRAAEAASASPSPRLTRGIEARLREAFDQCRGPAAKTGSSSEGLPAGGRERRGHRSSSGSGSGSGRSGSSAEEGQRGQTGGTRQGLAAAAESEAPPHQQRSSSSNSSGSGSSSPASSTPGTSSGGGGSGRSKSSSSRSEKEGEQEGPEGGPEEVAAPAASRAQRSPKHWEQEREREKPGRRRGASDELREYLKGVMGGDWGPTAATLRQERHEQQEQRLRALATCQVARRRTLEALSSSPLDATSPQSGAAGSAATQPRGGNGGDSGTGCRKEEEEEDGDQSRPFHLISRATESRQPPTEGTWGQEKRAQEEPQEAGQEEVKGVSWPSAEPKVERGTSYDTWQRPGMGEAPLGTRELGAVAPPAAGAGAGAGARGLIADAPAGGPRVAGADARAESGVGVSKAALQGGAAATATAPKRSISCGDSSSIGNEHRSRLRSHLHLHSHARPGATVGQGAGGSEGWAAKRSERVAAFAEQRGLPGRGWRASVVGDVLHPSGREGPHGLRSMRPNVLKERSFRSFDVDGPPGQEFRCLMCRGSFAKSAEGGTGSSSSSSSSASLSLFEDFGALREHAIVRHHFDVCLGGPPLDVAWCTSNM